MLDFSDVGLADAEERAMLFVLDGERITDRNGGRVGRGARIRLTGARQRDVAPLRGRRFRRACMLCSHLTRAADARHTVAIQLEERL